MAVFDHIEQFGEAPAVITGSDQSYSYIELASDADKIGGPAGATKLTAFIATNCYASIAGYVGMLRKGSIPLMLPSTVTATDLAEIDTAFSPDFIYAPIEMADKLGLGTPTLLVDNYGLYKTGASNNAPPHPSLALLLTTSGSTGGKSMVRLSANNISSNAEQIIEYLGIMQHDRAITTMPMSYSYGLSIINTHLMRGAAIIATESSLVSPDFWSLVRDCNATTFGGVPFIFEMLKKLRFHQMELPDLRYLTQAGGKLSNQLVTYFSKACTEKGCGFYVMYGQTEATARIAYLPAEQVNSRPDSIGIAIPNTEIWLENENGKKITSSNIEGELVFKGPNVSLGYAENRADLNTDDENKGIIKTGDIAIQDDDGYYYIVGRKKRFLKLYGNRINLAEVENILAKEGITAACAGTDDKMSIFVEGAHDTTDIKKTLQANTSIPPKGYTVVSIQELPRNESGKISYHLLNTEFAAG